jgi:integrase/recombinase XerD
VHWRPFHWVFARFGRHSLTQPESAEFVFPMSKASRKRRSRLVVEGPLVPCFESYFGYLADKGYSQISYWKKTFIVSAFSCWLQRKKVLLAEITSTHADAFLRDRSRHRNLKGARYALIGLMEWLHEKGIIARRAASFETSGIDRIVQEYGAYLREERGLTPSTLRNYGGHVRHFLAKMSSDTEFRPAAMRASEIRDYIRRRAPKDRTFASAKHVVTALRSFLRFARYRDYIRSDLAAAVPSVAGWSMASIPRAMPADSVRALLKASEKWRTPVGLRNHAILLLLARLGLRANEVIQLELGDIDWKEGNLSVHGKGRTERPLPLPHDVGEAIAIYLERGRPESTSRFVFLRSRAPFEGLKTHSDICQIVARAIARAGIEAASTGAHQLRHALAVDMLRRGASLTEIGQVLRHRSPDATRRYAKVDLDALREVALPWPGVAA